MNLNIILLFILMNIDCELIRKSLISCLIVNTREGSWPRYDCLRIINEYNKACKN